MKEIKCLIVMYNENMSDSNTIKTLGSQIANENLIVFDNSSNKDIAQINKEKCFECGIEYFGFNENLGLSKAYNHIINACKFDYIILADQDSSFNANFFESICNEVAKNASVDIFLPSVYSSNKLLSPSIIKGHRIKPFVFKKATQKNITAINSGMTIKKEVFNNVGPYDERFFLDCIDHNFMRKTNKQNMVLKVVDAELEQSFSGDTKPSQKSAEDRFRIFIKDFKIFCEDTIFGKMYYIIKINYRAIKLNRMYNTKAFTKILRS